MAILINIDQTITEVEPTNKEEGFRLKELYEMLDCNTVEVIDTKQPGMIMIIDENGKLRNDWMQRINLRATKYYPYGEVDPVVGNVLICKDEEFK